MRLSADAVSKAYGRRGRADGVLAVDEVSVAVDSGAFVAVVGESGSGKSTLARILLGLVEPDAGAVTLDGVTLTSMVRSQRRAFRSSVQCVLQDPSGALNPRKTVRRALLEIVRQHGIATGDEAEAVATETLHLVGLRPAAEFLDRYPHELSGGQRQRVLIARAVIPRPRIIIADEAVSALDVQVKASVLELMQDLRRDLGIGYLFITHDLAIAQSVADEVHVMKSGRIVESGSSAAIFARPRERYTAELLGAALDLDTVLERRFGQETEIGA